jgi:hypothetical protein
MNIRVEPENGTDLERYITALVNATGVVHQVVNATDCPPEMDGAEVIGVIAERLRGALAVLAEHAGDEELFLVTRVLAETTLLVAADLGLTGLFGAE